MDFCPTGSGQRSVMASKAVYQNSSKYRSSIAATTLPAQTLTGDSRGMEEWIHCHYIMPVCAQIKSRILTQRFQSTSSGALTLQQEGEEELAWLQASGFRAWD